MSEREPEFFTLPSLEDTLYWERNIAAGLHQPFAPELNGDPPADEADSWEPLNLADLEERPPVEPTLGLAGIAYPGKRHVFSGPQESAKTLAAYALGLEVVRDQNGFVVIIDFEMGAWEARDRLRDLGATTADFARIYYIDPAESATEDRIRRLVELGPTLVIIDAAAGAYDLQGLDDNKRADVERFTSVYVKQFWKAGIATVVLDHVTKDAETRGKYAIGSERKVGGADVHLGFEVITPIKRGTSGLYKVVTHKDRGGYLQRGTLANLHLTSDPVTHKIGWEFKEAEHVPEDEPWRPTILMGRVSDYLEQQSEPVSFNTVITNTKGRDEKVKEALEHLLALGFVTEEPGERGARMCLWKTHYPPPLPTSSDLFPEEDDSTSSTSSPPTGGEEEVTGRRKSSGPEEVERPFDVHDPAVQKLLDDDIPF